MRFLHRYLPRPGHGLQADGCTAQALLGLGSAEGYRRHRPQGDARGLESIPFFAQGDDHCADEDGQGQCAAASNALQGRALPLAQSFEAKSGQHLFGAVHPGNPRPSEEVWQQHPPPPHPVGDLGLGLQGQEADGAIGGGHGVDHIASQRGHVANLKRAHGSTGLGQYRGPLSNQRRFAGLAVGHIGAEDDHPVFQRHPVQLRDAGDVHQAISDPAVLGQLDDQVGAASH